MGQFTGPTGPPTGARLRVALIADGDLDDPRTNSGSAPGLARALAADPLVDLVPLIGRLPRWQRVGVAATHLRPGRRAWERAALKSRMTVVLRSRMRDAQLRRLTPPPDVVVHARNIYLPCRLPYACFVDTTVALSQGGWDDWRLPARLAGWRARTERRYLGGAIRVLTAGHAAARSAVTDAGVAPDRVEVVGAGTNPLPAPPAGIRRRPHDVVFVGLDWRRKGGDVLLAAWPAVLAAVPDAVLHLVGSGPEKNSAPVSASVVSYGRIARPELAGVLAAASIFCLPALFDPYALAVQEGMAAGLAVVVSDIGDLPLRVESTGAGIAVRAGDSAALADALVRLLSDSDLRDAMGARARAAATASSWSAVSNRVIAAVSAGLREMSGASGAAEVSSPSRT